MASVLGRNANDAGGRNLAGQRVPRDSIDVMSVKTGRALRERRAKVKVQKDPLPGRGGRKGAPAPSSRLSGPRRKRNKPLFLPPLGRSIRYRRPCSGRGTAVPRYKRERVNHGMNLLLDSSRLLARMEDLAERTEHPFMLQGVNRNGAHERAKWKQQAV